MLLRRRSYVALALLCLAACRTPARREEHARTPSPIVRVGSSIETIAADGRGVIVGDVADKHAFLARIVDGEPAWQWRSVEASASVTALTLDGDEVVVVGNFGEALTLGANRLVSVGASDCFVARFGVQQGDVRRAVRLGGPGEERCRAVAVRDHALYIAGSFSDRITLGSTSYTSRGSKDMFVALLSRDLDITRATQLGGRGNDLARGLAVDAQGGVVLVGQFGGEIELADGVVDFGDGPIASRGDFDAMVAYLDATGRPRWGRSLGGAGFDVAKTVRIDADGDIYVVGSLDLETTPPKTPEDWRLEGFLARYSARGEQRWLRRPANVTSLHSLVLDPREASTSSATSRARSRRMTVTLRASAKTTCSSPASAAMAAASRQRSSALLPTTTATPSQLQRARSSARVRGTRGPQLAS